MSVHSVTSTRCGGVQAHLEGHGQDIKPLVQYYNTTAGSTPMQAHRHSLTCSLACWQRILWRRGRNSTLCVPLR